MADERNKRTEYNWSWSGDDAGSYRAKYTRGFDPDYVKHTAERREEQEENTERSYSKFLGLIPMIASVVAFILTEDMRNLMVLKDRFTIPMIVIALFELVLAFITRNRKYEEEKEEEEELLIEA